jgi:hypothetical protein
MTEPPPTFCTLHILGHSLASRHLRGWPTKPHVSLPADGPAMENRSSPRFPGASPTYRHWGIPTSIPKHSPIHSPTILPAAPPFMPESLPFPCLAARSTQTNSPVEPYRLDLTSVWGTWGISHRFARHIQLTPNGCYASHNPTKRELLHLIRFQDPSCDRIPVTQLPLAIPTGLEKQRLSPTAESRSDRGPWRGECRRAGRTRAMAPNARHWQRTHVLDTKPDRLRGGLQNVEAGASAGPGPLPQLATTAVPAAAPTTAKSLCR